MHYNCIAFRGLPFFFFFFFKIYFVFLKAGGGRKGHRNRNTSIVPNLFVFTQTVAGLLLSVSLLLRYFIQPCDRNIKKTSFVFLI